MNSTVQLVVAFIAAVSLLLVVESLRHLKAGNFKPDDNQLKCYLRCFMAKIGILNNDNDIDLEKVLRLLPRDMRESSERILTRCESIPNDACDKAFLIARCYVKAQPEILKRASFV